MIWLMRLVKYMRNEMK
jgi:hypothetical protein